MRYKNLLLILASILIFTSCMDMDQDIENLYISEQTTTKVQEQSENPESGGTLKIAIRNPSTLNPLLNEDESVDEVLKLIYDDLIGLDNELKPTPSIASSWSLSPDGNVIVNLRNDIYWHNGQNLTSEDVIFSIETIRKSQETSAYKYCVKNILSCTAIDTYTVSILFNEPSFSSIYSLNFPIISASYYRDEDVLTSAKNLIPMGTGAYTFDSFNKMKNLNLNKNPLWFKGTPYIDKIEAIVIPKEDAEVYAFDQGQVDFLNTKVVDWEKYSGTKETTIREYTTNYYDFIGFNFNNPNLNNINVRKAFAYAIPKQRIIEEIYLKHAIQTETPLNPVAWYNTNKDLKYTYNLGKSKELLAQAGFADSDQNGILDKEGQEFRLSLLVNEENEQRIETANIIKESFKLIGIELTVDIQNFEEYNKRLTDKNFELVLGGWKLSSIPNLNFAFHSSQIATGTNFISYNNPAMDNLLYQANLAMTEKSIIEGYKNLSDYIIEDLPYISLYFRNAAVLMNNNVKGNINSNLSNVYLGIEKCFIINQKKE